MSSETLEAVFATVGAAFTGTTAAGFAAVGGAAALGGYALWANDNPEQASEFEAWASKNLVSQGVASTGYADQISLPLSTLPADVVSSIAKSAAGTYSDIPFTYPHIEGVPDGLLNIVSGIYCPSSLVDYWKSKDANWANKATVTFYNATNGSWWLLSGQEDYQTDYFQLRVSIPDNFMHLDFVGRGGSNVGRMDAYILNSAGKFEYSPSYGASTNGSYINWYTLQGRQFYLKKDYPVYITYTSTEGAVIAEPVQNVTADTPVGISGSLADYLSGTITLDDFRSAILQYVGAVRLPGMTVDVDTASVVEAPSVPTASTVYADIVFDPAQWDTITGGGTVNPDVPTDDILSALSGLASQMTQVIDVVTSIPPLIPGLPAEIARAIGGGVIDIPAQIDELRGAIIDIPGQVGEIADTIIDIPGAIDAARGAIIDLPAELWDLVGPVVGGISTGVTGLQGTLTDVWDSVISLPAEIAGALNPDWALTQSQELKSRLPELPSVLVLPQATFDDLKNIGTEYKDKTPVGKVFKAYEGVFDVISDGGGGGSSAPRYEITFPPPIDYTFVIDFATFDGGFVQVAHAFFYMLAIFWYMRFLRTVKRWYDFFIGRDSPLEGPVVDAVSDELGA